MIALAIILGYLFVIALLAWVIEPCLRLRFGWYFIKPDPNYIGYGDPNREVLGPLIAVFWPIGIPIFFLTKYVLLHVIVGVYKNIIRINNMTEKFWTPKPKTIPEKIVDESKSNYRNFAFIEKDKVK